MVNFIYKDSRNSNLRFIITAAKAGESINNLSFLHPLYEKKELEVNYLKTQLFLLDYLKLTCPSNKKLTVEYVVDSIPKDLLDKVYGVELIDIFYCSEFSDVFYEDAKKRHNVVFVALLTEEDTGKALPNGKMPTTKPIGISDDEWARVCRKFNFK